ncbi:MAG TPA: tyrosine--tRNA ligase [Candidatus Nanoarchaeia archaeon]|nr:tyrosine--tRNA ligase [Candidatus Nanoarchaeia archaeon]
MLKLFSGGSDKVSTDPQKIHEILTRGVEEIFVKESLEAKLKSGKKLRVKLGIDPTGKNVHIGNAVTFWKLRAFQDLGHQAVIVVGDFTAQIGDPSDKLEKRPMLDAEQIKENLNGYKKQLAKIIDINKAEIVYNSAWLSKLKFDEITKLAESFTVQQMTNRRNFKERIEKGIEVSLREFMYPLMQGYDSVAVKADVELGGFDQLFNVKAGRAIQKHYGQREQDVLTTQMINGTDGRKMSKSWGNVINVMDEPDQMFGKAMSIRDDLMPSYFLLCTDMPMNEAEKIAHRLERGENPRDLKLELAQRMTALYWGEKEAEKAKEKFIEVFSEKKIPDDIKAVTVNPGTKLVDVMLKEKIVDSKSEWRRLLGENAVSDAETGNTITDPNITVEEKIYRVGKRRWLKIKINS